MTTEQKKINDRYFTQIIKITNCWHWIDEGITFKIVDDRFVAPDKKSYDKLCKIVTKDFQKKHINFLAD